MAENRREKDKRFYFTRGQMVLLGGAFTVAAMVIFVLGMFVGKQIEARKIVQPEQSTVKVPVKPASQDAAAAQTARSKDDLTFYNTLTKSPAAEKTAEKEAEKTVKAPDKRLEKPVTPAPPAAKAGAKEDAPGKADDKIWSVQVNAYPDEKSAGDLVDRLKNKGYNAYVTEASNKGKIWYRVRVGRFSSRDEAEKIESALKSKENLPSAFATRK